MFIVYIKQIIFKILKPFAEFIPLKYKQPISLKIKRILFTDQEIIERSGIRYIDKSETDKKIRAMGNISGIDSSKRNPRLIVSLTSYPERMNDLKYTLYSILNQTLKPNEIVLWLSHEEFPKGESEISDDILNLKKNGLTIKFCHNIRSYKKLIPALKEYPDCIIITIDDDVYYDMDLIEKLYKTYEKQPYHIHCSFASAVAFKKSGELLPLHLWKKKRIPENQKTPSFLNLAIGVGGVLYPPGSLYQDVLKEELFLKLTPTADDIWFWTMAVMQGTKINVIDPFKRFFHCVNPEIELGLINATKLSDINVIQRKNDEQFNQIVEHYSLYCRLRDCFFKNSLNKQK